MESDLGYQLGRLTAFLLLTVGLIVAGLVVRSRGKRWWWVLVVLGVLFTLSSLAQAIKRSGITDG